MLLGLGRQLSIIEYYEVPMFDMDFFNIVLVSVKQSYTSIKTIVSLRKIIPCFEKETQQAVIKRYSQFKKSREHSKMLQKFKKVNESGQQEC